MYNKLFTKILDSSVWLESVTTRIVWLTLIAAMDEEGFAPFAAVGNLASRARVSVHDCEKALKVLESPDTESADPDHEGRRIERVPGGWIVLNATKYREMVTRVVAQERTRERVRKHRREKAGNGAVTVGNGSVTPSEADTGTKADTKAQAKSVERARTTNVNPHNKPTNLVNGSELRRHGSHAWCSDRGMCVPYALHKDIVARTGRAPEAVKQFYADVMASWPPEHALPGNVFQFWNNLADKWTGAQMPSGAATVTNTKGNNTLAAAQRVAARYLQEHLLATKGES